MALSILAMFPGQGSQHVGMGKDFLEQFPKAKLSFEEAADAISLDIKKLCFEGPDDQLALTANTQPCILTLSVAIWRTLCQELGIAPTAFAGHSLGEYSAVVASGKLDFSRAVYLVRRRGEAMQEAVPSGVGAMAAVLNPEIPTLNQWCKDITTTDHSVEVVNYNSPQQVVVAGHKLAVEELCTKLEGAGKKFVMLNVSAPFHSRLMVKAREAMTPLLKDTQFKSNDTTVIANLSGEPVRTYQADYLIKQIDSPVLWTQSMQSAEAMGCELYVEVGPGKVLFGLARRCLSKKDARLVVTADIRKAITELKDFV